MSHARTAIRSALTDLLLNNTDAESRVYSNRGYNIPQSQLPAIVILDELETAQSEGIQRGRYIRTLLVRIEIYAESTGEALDDIASDVEVLISANSSITGTAINSRYVSTEFSYDDAQRTTGRATMIFEIQYIA